MQGTHERQLAFIEGEGAEEGWGDDDDEGDEEEGKERGGEKGTGKRAGRERGRLGRWESGKGRCAVTGRRVLGGTDGLRRVMV